MVSAASALAALERDEPVDLLDADLYPDPGVGAVLAWLRDHAPAYRDANGLVCISRHADLCAVERNAALYTSLHGSRPLLDMSADRSMINLDDPAHATQRRLIVRRFTPHGIRPHGEHIRAITAELVDGFARRGTCDLVEELAAVLPATVICELLGFNRDRWRDCEQWARETITAGSLRHDDPRMPDYMTSLMAFLEATGELIAERRSEPKDDLVSIWTQAEIETDEGRRPLTDKEILEEALLVLDGGAETTRGVIALGAVALCRFPDERAKLLDDPTLLERCGTEEMIRWVTPIHNMRRTATQDHELHGVPIGTGDEILLMYGSANRDPRAIDRPDEFDVSRTGNHHVAFGFGTHYCVGANLARFEITNAFGELLRRIPEFDLDGEPIVAPGFFTRGLHSLPLRFTPETTAP